MSKRRLDAQDTIDAAIRYLQTMQSDGWCMSEMEHVIGYGDVGKKSALLPTDATVIIRLRPVHE